jgi:hypothetical protein
LDAAESQRLERRAASERNSTDAAVQLHNWKDATDSALIIDAMDLLHSKTLDGFCIVSSDCDFTRLATRIREAGLIVYGFGEQKTPEPFRAACNKFVFLEILKQTPASTEEEAEKPAVEVPKLKPLLMKALEASVREDGWAALGLVGSTLQKIDSSFDERNYGFKKLSDLVRKQSYLEVEPRAGKEGAAAHLFARVGQQCGCECLLSTRSRDMSRGRAMLTASGAQPPSATNLGEASSALQSQDRR